MFFTTYFAQVRRLDPKKSNLVSIARYTPKGFLGRIYLPLAPSPSLLSYVKRTGDEEGYTKRFKAYLETLDVHKVAKDLKDGAILVCYETPEKFCHRHLVADWLREAGYKVCELKW